MGCSVVIGAIAMLAILALIFAVFGPVFQYML